MSIPGNGIFVVRGELSTIMTSMKRTSRWNSYQNENPDKLTKSFIKLKESLLQIEDLKLIKPDVYLDPFLDVIRSEETTGPITSIALSAVNKFLSYGLIDPTNPNLASIVENIADSVTHARFVGADSSSDGTVLLRIVQVLRTLMLSPEGSALSNESVCEIILSCFRICFETRLNELLRRTAEHALRDMILLLFMRLPQFVEDLNTFNIKCLQIRPENTSKSTKAKSINDLNDKPLSVKPVSADTDETKTEEGDKLLATVPVPADPTNENESIPTVEATTEEEIELPTENVIIEYNEEPSKEIVNEDYINSVGIRFTNTELETYTPYGIPCIRELFRFLISLCNPLDAQNTDSIIQIALNLLTVVFEVASDNIGNFYSLIALVKDELCRSLFSLLNTERLPLFAANLQVCFLLFESLRYHLKFQLENYLIKLSDIIVSENTRIVYETRELALDNLLQLFRVPGFAAELYINYDCDLYCANLFENITKLLSKNALSAAALQTIYGTHLLSLDTLLTIISSINRNCSSFKKGNAITYKRHSRNNSNANNGMFNDDEATTDRSVYINTMDTFVQYNNMYNRFSGKLKVGDQLTEDKMNELKNKKRILSQGTELFNQRPEKGIQFMQENGIINSTLDPLEIAHFLRESPGLDKKQIGEYISKKKNVESKILEVFVKSFDFTATRIDKALRLYLETFRLPGEAPLIFLVMEHFADHWHKCNSEPFFNTDAAFRLAYAIIMLNMDQHNYNAKKLNIPMTAEDFVKNLRGLNGSSDFAPEMLHEVFNAIKNEEIIMPAEQTGIVRENYLWKVLLRRGEGKDGEFNHVSDPTYDKQLFQITWGSTLAALGSLFDKNTEVTVTKKIMEGFMHSAAISSHYNLHQEFDAIILTLCKFTTLYNATESNEITLNVQFGQNAKARMSIKSIFNFLHEYGDCMRESWKHVIDLIVQLYKLGLLSKSFLEVEDFCNAEGKIWLRYEQLPTPKTEASLLSSLYLYLSSESQRQPSYEEQDIIKLAKKCIKECQIDQIIVESKFLHHGSLSEVISYLLTLIKPPTSHKSVGVMYEENLVIFHLELLTKILIQNRDRVLPFWSKCSEQLHLLIINAASCGYNNLLLRTTIALFKLAIYLMRNEELSSTILQSLKIFLRLKPKVLFQLALPVSTGMFELLKTSAQNIHTECDWSIVFSILECVGAGSIPPESAEHMISGTRSDGALSSEDENEVSDRGYTSDSEIINRTNQAASLQSGDSTNWILVDKDHAEGGDSNKVPLVIASVIYHCKLGTHSPIALVKCWDSLAFVVRNVAHITPYNFEICVRCIRTFVEASLNGGNSRQPKNNNKATVNRGKNVNVKRTVKNQQNDEKKDANGDVNKTDDESDFPERYQTIAIQLLDLMHTLHTRTAQIFRWWAEEGGTIPQCTALWSQGWCPLLQGIARISTDHRRQVRTSAITCLQRALLMHDLQTLSGPEWAGCFRQVLFPLMTFLLNETPAVNGTEAFLIEESRIRIATIMSKVFLHHLTPLMTLGNFHELWLEIIQYLEQFMKLGTDMLYEAVLESLKNMLLVMYSVKAFHNNDGSCYSVLWEMTWQRVGSFLPTLKDELFKDNGSENPMLQVSANVRQIPLPVKAVIVEKEVLEPSAELTARMNEVIPPQLQMMASPLIESPNLHNNILTHPSMSPSQSYPMFVTNETTSPCLENGSPIVSISTIHSAPTNDNHEHFETYSEASDIELIIQSNSYEMPTAPPTVQQMIPPQNDVKVPSSHLMQMNQYPGAARNVGGNIPIDIVKSFPPALEHQVEKSTSNDIYSDYTNDPYNLTLQIDSQFNNDINTATPPNNSTASMFQNASSYFTSDSSDLIPPGSEMLFNRP
ncbi:unnamed protein product [Diamesa tonsa]